MYVLVIGRAFPDEKTGMMGIFEFEQATALKKAGIKTVYAFCDTRSIKLLRTVNYTAIMSKEVPVYGYHFPIGGLPRVFFERLKENMFQKVLKKVVHEQGAPDIIHVHFPLLNLTETIWNELKNLNRPIVVTEHWSKVQTKQIEPFRIELLKRVVSESDSFMCVGEQLRKSVIELTNTKKEIIIMPNMIKPYFYYRKKEIQDNSFKFITIGRLVENKRVDFVIKAFTEVFEKDKGITLEIVGDGVMFNEIQRLISDLGMADRITMHGFISREETADLLKECDVFVSASILETFGVPFIEAMACGKPIIGIKNGPIDSYINDSNGVLFEQDNIIDLKNKLYEVSQKRDFYESELIADTAKQLFGEETIILKVISTYREFSN